MAHSIFIDHYITSENALIQIENGSGVTGLATSLATTLTAYHYNIMSPSITASQNYPKTEIIDYSGGKKPYTINYLQQRFGVTAQKMTRPPATAATSTTAVTAQPDIVVIVGSDYASAQSRAAVSSTP
jgi:hypothetical protein